MAARSDVVEPKALPELLITRVFDAPRSLVFKVWTEPQHMVRWCAPHGFAITHSEGDLRPGGAWRSCMVSPDGLEFGVGGVYREIVPPERLVFTHVWDETNGQNGQETLVTLTFADFEERKTKMYFRQQFFLTESSRDGHEGGWSESFERLNDYLNTLQKEQANHD